MTSIVNRGKPAIQVKRELTASVNCPNCQAIMGLDATDVDIGNIIQCSKCKKKTYYPFEKPWYRKAKNITFYIFSVVVSYFIGIASSVSYDVYKEPKIEPKNNSAATQQIQRK